MLPLQNYNYKSITPSLVNAANLIPTGRLSKAEIKAMCSFPSPDAMLKATSVPEIFPFNLFCNSSLSSLIFLFKSILINSNFFRA